MIFLSAPGDFMENAVIGGMAEVEMGKLAASKATNPEVKKFGQMIADDHLKANAELQALAAKRVKRFPLSSIRQKNRRLTI